MSETNRAPRRPQKKNETGSEDAKAASSEPEFLIVGQIARPHGVRGEMAMKILTDFPEHLADVETFYLGSHYEPLHAIRLRRVTGGILVLFDGVTSREQAERYRGALTHISLKDAVPLRDGEVYLYQIQGIRVVTEDGEELGRLADLIETGANDVYIVKNEQGEELLLPAIPDVIRNIDVAKQVMTVHLLAGLK